MSGKPEAGNLNGGLPPWVLFESLEPIEVKECPVRNGNTEVGASSGSNICRVRLSTSYCIFGMRAPARQDFSYLWTPAI